MEKYFFWWKNHWRRSSTFIRAQSYTWTTSYFRLWKVLCKWWRVQTAATSHLLPRIFNCSNKFNQYVFNKIQTGPPPRTCFQPDFCTNYFSTTSAQKLQRLQNLEVATWDCNSHLLILQELACNSISCFLTHIVLSFPSINSSRKDCFRQESCRWLVMLWATNSFGYDINKTAF